MDISPWIQAARLRTLPLAISGILMGSCFAYYSGSGLRWSSFILCLLTATLLQVLSNYANDYGDYYGGADNNERIGPARQLQSGTITPTAMRNAMIILIAITLVSCTGLLCVSIGHINWRFIFFFGIGLSAIWAAIKYTVGKNAYGYRALGDLFVFLFFGLVAVLGSYFLTAVHAHSFYWALLPAVFIGCWSIGVLNLNNIRDLDSDALAGKKTIAMKLGERKAKTYQTTLICIGWLSMLALEVLYFDLSSAIYLLLIIPFVANHLKKVMSYSKEDYNPLLKQLSLMTLLTVILFVINHTIISLM